MDPKNSLPTLEQAQAYFNKVLSSRAAGVPLDFERPVDDEEEDDEDGSKPRDDESSGHSVSPDGSSVANVMAQAVDKDHDGVVTLKEFKQFEETLRKARPEAMKKGSMADMHKLMDKNKDGEVTTVEARDFFALLTGAFEKKEKPHT